jgi:hypothetical protein
LFRAPQLRLHRAIGRFCDTELALRFGMFGLQAFEVGGLPQGVGAQGTEGGGEGFALCCIALRMCTY